MSVLAPLFFVALAGLAVPVLIHLIQREKKRVVKFPSLMFLERIPYQSVRRRRIHNWMLLVKNASSRSPDLRRAKLISARNDDSTRSRSSLDKASY